MNLVEKKRNLPDKLNNKKNKENIRKMLNTEKRNQNLKEIRTYALTVHGKAITNRNAHSWNQ